LLCCCCCFQDAFYFQTEKQINFFYRKIDLFIHLNLLKQRKGMNTIMPEVLTLSFETVMSMDYNAFYNTFVSFLDVKQGGYWFRGEEEEGFSYVCIEKPISKSEQEEPCLSLSEGVYCDFLDWSYYNRHLLQYFTMKDLYELAPTFYSHERRWYIVNKKDLSYKLAYSSLSPPRLRRLSNVTLEEIENVFHEDWVGPFSVTPRIYLDSSDLLQEFLSTCL